ncbi:hypothetical protein GW17_00050101 [Ensete ventricosum]|nr:hypothetical protein GW17_00050101 [Ensete ventricosum]
MVTRLPRRPASDNWPADVADPTREASRAQVWGRQRSYGRPDAGKADTLTCRRMPYWESDDEANGRRRGWGRSAPSPSCRFRWRHDCCSEEVVVGERPASNQLSREPSPSPSGSASVPAELVREGEGRRAEVALMSSAPPIFPCCGPLLLRLYPRVLPPWRRSRGGRGGCVVLRGPAPAPAHSRHRLDQAPLLVLRRTPCAVNAAAGCSHRSAREPTRPRTTRFASDVRPYRTHSRVGWAPIWPRKIKRRRPASDRKSRMTSPRRLLPSSLPNSDLVLSAVVVTHRPQLRL